MAVAVVDHAEYVGSGAIIFQAPELRSVPFDEQSILLHDGSVDPDMLVVVGLAKTAQPDGTLPVAVTSMDRLDDDLIEGAVFLSDYMDEDGKVDQLPATPQDFIDHLSVPETPKKVALKDKAGSFLRRISGRLLH